MASVVRRRIRVDEDHFQNKVQAMKLYTCLIAALCVSSCAGVPESADPNVFSKTEIDIAVSSHFDVPKSAVSRALQPSFDKFGHPSRYIEGRMSSIDKPDLQRLYGAGESRARLGLPAGIFWQIDGQGLSGQFDPIQTVHLVYESALPTGGAFSATNMETRRGETFTVFERQEDERIVVSLYPTQHLPKTALFESLSFRIN